MFEICGFIQTLHLSQNRILTYEETQMRNKAIIALAIGAIISGNA